MLSSNTTSCYKCGRPLGNNYTLIGNEPFCVICSNEMNKPAMPVGMQGWICPVCGKGNSPFVKQCDCQPYQVTYTTTDMASHAQNEKGETNG